MSFILDALKKLEHNRKRGEVPDLTTVHLQDHEPPKKKATWPYLLLAALLLNAGILTAWLRPWEEIDNVTEKSEIQVADAETVIRESEVNKDDIVSTPAEDKKAAEEISAPDAKPENITKNKEDVVSTPAEDKKVSEEISTAVTESEKPADISDEEVIASIGLDPTPEELDMLRDKIEEERDIIIQMPVEEVIKPLEPDVVEPENKGSFIEFSQLPENVRKELPDITINGHIYSDIKAARIATINGYVTREGDKVSSGLILEEITTAGVIFSFKEYRFRMRAF